MQRDTIALTNPATLMLPKRVGVAPFHWRRVAAVFAALGFAVYLAVLQQVSFSR